MFGLTTNPTGLSTAGTNYAAINYAWFFYGSLQIYESGASIGAVFPVFTTSTVVSITYDGTNIKYWIDGALCRSVALAVGSPLYACWAGFNTAGTVGGIRNVQFDNYGDITAPLGGRVVNGLNCQGLAAQWACSGGGTINFLSNATSGYDLYWSVRFICIPVSQQGYSSAGFFDITCPTSGTITVITGNTTTSTVNCTSRGINLPANWVALYYILRPGNDNTSVQSNFVVVSYNTAGGWTTNSNWILIGTTNLDVSISFKCVPAQVNIPLGQGYTASTDTRSTVNAGSITTSGTLFTPGYVDVTNSNPGDLISKRYGPSDRYGIGQYTSGTVRVFTSGTYAPASICFSKAADDLRTGAATFTDLMTITSSGTVGIGIVSPVSGATLDVNGTGVFRGEITNYSYAGQYISLNTYWDGSKWNKYTPADGGFYIRGDNTLDGGNGGIQFGTQLTGSANLGASPRITIANSSGNVGIGLSGIGYGQAKLFAANDVTLIGGNYAGDVAAQVMAVGATNSNKRLAMMYDTTNNIGLVQAMIAGTGPSPLCLNAAGGSVGIGTASPATTLDVNGAISVGGTTVIDSSRNLQNIGNYNYQTTGLTTGCVNTLPNNNGTNIYQWNGIALPTSLTVLAGTTVQFHFRLGGYATNGNATLTWTIDMYNPTTTLYENISTFTMFCNTAVQQAFPHIATKTFSTATAYTYFRIACSGTTDNNSRVDVSWIKSLFN